MVVQHFLGKEKAGGSSPPVGSQFNKTVSLHLLVHFLPRSAARKCSSAQVLIPSWCWQATVTGTTFIGVGETIVRDQSAAEAPS